ncbi:MAG TPA: diacylglycerol kinase family protein [Rhizomicrobium sp.]
MTPDLRALRIGVALNTSSGTCDESARDRLEAVLLSARLQPVQIHCVSGEKLSEALDRLVAAQIDVLIVLGGDGTIRSAAERCAGNGIMLIALPGGTMNLLPKALYDDRDWESALKATLARPRLEPVSGGQVNEHLFFCAGIFGAASLWTEVREAVRSNQFVDAVRRSVRAFRRTFTRRVTFAAGTASRRRTAAAVAVICPLASSALKTRSSAFEIAALNFRDAREAFRLAVTALFANWRSDPAVTTSVATSVAIDAGKRFPAVLDGELVHLEGEIVVSFKPQLFTALVPDG